MRVAALIIPSRNATTTLMVKDLASKGSRLSIMYKVMFAKIIESLQGVT